MSNSFGSTPVSSAAEQGRLESPCVLPVFVGPLVRSRQTKPCPTYFEISFLEDNISADKNNDTARRRLSAIVFRNFYCSHISIKQRRDPQLAVATSFGTVRGIIDVDPWVTVLRDRALMEDPHFENDAQDWHVVTVEEFDQDYDANSTAPLRVYLYQPSPMWKTIALQHVKCVSWSGCQDGKRTNVHRDETFVHGDFGGHGLRLPPRGENSLGELCRGISQQVGIFRDRNRTGRTWT